MTDKTKPSFKTPTVAKVMSIDKTGPVVGIEDTTAMLNKHTITNLVSFFNKLSHGELTIDLSQPFIITMSDDGLQMPTLTPFVNQIHYLMILCSEARASNRKGFSVVGSTINKEAKDFLVSNPTLFKLVDSNTNNQVMRPKIEESKPDELGGRARKIDDMLDRMSKPRVSSPIEKEKGDAAKIIEDRMAESKVSSKDEEFDKDEH